MTLDHKPSTLEYQQLYKSFTNQTIDPIELPFVVAMGQSFGNWADAPRSADTWTLAQYVGVDLEKHRDADLDTAISHQFYKAYGYMGYTTMSHQWDDPRSRLVFLLSEPVRDRELWHWGARAISEMFLPAADLAAADRGRAFLGNPYASIVTNGRILPIHAFNMLARTRQRKQEKDTAEKRSRIISVKGDEKFSTHDALLALAGMVDRMRNAAEGNRNNLLNWCAYMAGKNLVRDGASPVVLEAALIEAALQCGLDEVEATRTVKSAMTKGMRG